MHITAHPLHRSGLAELPHPAPVSGDNRKPQVKPLRRVRMTDSRCGNPALHFRFETLPREFRLLAPTPQRPVPEPGHMVDKGVQTRTVKGHTIVLVVSPQHRAYPFPLFPQVGMHSSVTLLLQFLQLRLHPLPHRLAKHRIPPTSCLPANMREPKKVEGLRFALASLLPVARRMPSKLDQSSLSLMQLQLVFAHPFAQLSLEPCRVLPRLEADNEIVRISHDDHCSSRFLLTPSLHPLVEYVVKVDVRKHWTDQSSLRRPLLATSPFPFFHDSCSEPFLDQGSDPSVTYPVLDHPDQPFVGDAIKVPSNVRIKHPVDWSLLDSYSQCIKRIVRRSPWPESIREALELRLPDGRQNLCYHPLDDLVFQCRYPQSSLPPIRLRDIYPSYCRSPICTSYQPSREGLESYLKLLSVVLPRLSIDPCCGILPQAEVCLAQVLDLVDVMKQRHQPLLWPSPHCLPYASERLLHAFIPALCPGRGALFRIPLDQPPSLHPLRRRLRRSFVRGLRRYYAAVRLPIVVHHRRSSTDFPTRPTAPSLTLGNDGLSRVSRTIFLHMPGVFDRAEPAAHSPYRAQQFCLRASGRLSALRVSPFRGSIPSLCIPLSTLGLRNYSRLPMTRSQTGWLGLVCSGLSPPTYCRLTGAVPRGGLVTVRLRTRGFAPGLEFG